MIIVRFADDVVTGFEHESERHPALLGCCASVEEIALSLHPDKTRLIEFGRYAADRRVRARKTGDLPRALFSCARSRKGKSLLKRKSGSIACGAPTALCGGRGGRRAL
jgi:hypothetical protein